MLGRTPPAATVTPPRNLFSSSSLRTARVMWRGHDARLLVVARGVARQLEDLGGHVLEHGGQVDGRAGADARGVPAELDVAVHAAHRELQARLRRARSRLLLRATTSTFDHFEFASGVSADLGRAFADSVASGGSCARRRLPLAPPTRLTRAGLYRRLNTPWRRRHYVNGWIVWMIVVVGLSVPEGDIGSCVEAGPNVVAVP